jgi:glycosyltransferase involved in cell wall biosynthesis
MATPTSSRYEPFERDDLPVIVVSAVALVAGGPLTILNQAVASARRFDGANFLFLVHDAGPWPTAGNVRLAAIPWARRSYPQRIYAEYVLFPRLSRQWRPNAWLSLQDTTPPVTAGRQAVYCQNPLPYWRPTLQDLRLDPATVLRARVYGLVYRAFADRNDHIIGQLPWYTEFIGTYMGVPPSRWLVVRPTAGPPSPIGNAGRSVLSPDRNVLHCLYPSLPRVFKNFEEAIALCDQPGLHLTLTLTGRENRYARHVRARAERFPNVRLIGRLSHENTLATMAQADVVLFPSRLETFGLPIKEAIELDRTLVLPVRPWTTAIAADHDKTFFYRSTEQGRAILAALARGERPPVTEPPTIPEPDLTQVEGFDALYRLLLE